MDGSFRCIQFLARCIFLQWMTLCNYNMWNGLWNELLLIYRIDNSNLLPIHRDGSHQLFFGLHSQRKQIGQLFVDFSVDAFWNASSLSSIANRISLIFHHSYRAVTCSAWKIEQFAYEQLTRFMALTVQWRSLVLLAYRMHVTKWKLIVCARQMQPNLIAFCNAINQLQMNSLSIFQMPTMNLRIECSFHEAGL